MIEANPEYAHVKFPNGRESTVSLRDLAPGINNNLVTNTDTVSDDLSNSETIIDPNSSNSQPITDLVTDVTNDTMPEQQTLRRSQRQSRAPVKLDL